MNKGMKTFLMICGIVIGVGVILSIIGLALGGIKGLAGVESRVPWVSLGGSGTVETQNVDTGKFTAADIKCDMGSVEFIKSDKYGVEVSYDKKLRSPRIEVKGDTLNIESRARNRGWFNLNIFNLPDYKDTMIKVYYPENTVFGNINIDSDLGDVILDGIKAQTVNASLDAGDISVDRVIADNLKVNADLGDIKGNHVTTKSADIDVNMGNAALNGNFAGTTKISCDMGDCDLTTGLAKDSYAIKAEVDLGECSVDGQNVGGTYTVDNASAANRLEIKCDAGDVDVKFQ